MPGLGFAGLCVDGLRVSPGQWASNNRPGEHSCFRIGQPMLDRLRLKIGLIPHPLLETSQSVIPDWG